jgi:hypothetical protein
MRVALRVPRSRYLGLACGIQETSQRKSHQRVALSPVAKVFKTAGILKGHPSKNGSCDLLGYWSAAS